MKKQVLFIYRRREILTFTLIFFMISLFCFTLGLHYGKSTSIPTTPSIAKNETHHLVDTLNDKIPNLQELTAPGENAIEALDHTVNDETKKEASGSGLTIEHPRQLDLPHKPRSKTAGATTLVNSGSAYTLQVGSYSSKAEAEKQVSAFKKGHLNPSLREVEIPGKGKWFRVFLGSFPNLKSAEQAGQIYRSQSKITSYIITKVE